MHIKHVILVITYYICIICAPAYFISFCCIIIDTI